MAKKVKRAARIRNLPLHVRAEMALREAVRKEIVRRARLGLPVYISNKGKVVALSPEQALSEVSKKV